MIDHLTAETLSAYLDEELAARQADRVRDHLDDCPECRHELDGLRRTVRALQSLEREAPPDLLALRVRRSVALELEEQPFAGRLERLRLNLPVASSTLLTFALVFALATILYLFAHAMEQRRRIAIPVDFGPAPVETAVEEVPELVWDGQAWVEAPVPTESEPTIVRRGSAEWKGLVAAHPELSELPEVDGPVLVTAGEGLRVRIEP